MTALHEISASDRFLTDEDIRRYQADGAVLVRNLLQENILSRVRDELDERIHLLAGKHGVALPEGSGNTLSAISRKLIALDQAVPGTQSSLYDAMTNAPSLHQASTQEPLMKTVSLLVPGPPELHHRFILIMSLPRATWHLAQWHQDWYYNEGSEGTVTVYAPLQETTDDNGSLLLALGEHKRGPLPHGAFDQGFENKWHVIDPSIVDSFDDLVSVAVGAGDVLFMHSLLPHSARVNRSESVRFVLNFRYLGLADPKYLDADWEIGAISHARAALARKN